MTTLKNINEFQSDFMTHYVLMLEDLVNEQLRVWEDEDSNDQCNYFTFNGSNSSGSQYWTIGSNEMDEFCVRVSDHRCVNCHSKVHHNVNLMDFITIEADPDGYEEDDEWFIDVDKAEAAIREAANMLLERIK